MAFQQDLRRSYSSSAASSTPSFLPSCPLVSGLWSPEVFPILTKLERPCEWSLLQLPEIQAWPSHADNTEQEEREKNKKRLSRRFYHSHSPAIPPPFFVFERNPRKEKRKKIQVENSRIYTRRKWRSLLQIKVRKFQKAKTVVDLQKMCFASLIDKVREIVFLRTIAT